MIGLRAGKIFILILILFAVLFVYPQITLANPPEEVKLSYDSKEQVLTVTITHKSPFPRVHYINRVEIKKNGNLVSDNKYGGQPDIDTFAYSYKVPAADGENLEAKVSCNLYGSKTASVTAGKQMPDVFLAMG